MGAQFTVLLGARVDYTGARVRELGQLDAVLFAQQALVVTSLLDIIQLDRLVAGRNHEKLALIVVVNG